MSKQPLPSHPEVAQMGTKVSLSQPKLNLIKISNNLFLSPPEPQRQGSRVREITMIQCLREEKALNPSTSDLTAALQAKAILITV